MEFGSMPLSRTISDSFSLEEAEQQNKANSSEACEHLREYD